MTRSFPFAQLAFQLGLALAAGAPASAITVPSGFQVASVATGISQPAVIAFAPDGRLFIGDKSSGTIRVVDGTLQATPLLRLSDFITAPAYYDSYFERGLLGIAFDSSFATNHFVYVYYTICKVPGSSTCQTAVNRIVRFTTSGDLVVPGSQAILLDDIPNDAGNHNAGWIDVGPDGKLYASVGDGGSVHTKAQDLTNLNGKVLRININGSIPSDNPYVGQAGLRPEVRAYGFRNPWRCRFQPGTGRLFCADVGESTWEEIDLVAKGLNFGWPTTEGPFTQASFPQFTTPLYWYNHNGLRAAIT